MLVRTVSGMRRRGLDVTLCVPERGPLLELVAREGVPSLVLGFPVLRKALLSPTGIGGLALGWPWHVTRLLRLMARHRPDIVYVNTLTLPHWLSATRVAGVPSVCHVHELQNLNGRLLARALTAPPLLADRVISNSQATARYLEEYWGRFSSRGQVVYNGFAFPEPALDRRRQEGPARIVLVGRLSPHKGQDLAIDAIAQLLAGGYDVELDLVGSTFRGYEWYERDLVEQARRLGVSERVTFSGYRPSVWDSYAAADIAIVPSRIESFGNVAVEAMAIGRPVVATRVGGLPEIVEDAHTGLVVAPDDVHGLRSALQRLLDDPDWATALGRNGSEVARRRFTQERYERELTEAVLMAGGRGPA